LVTLIVMIFGSVLCRGIADIEIDQITFNYELCSVKNDTHFTLLFYISLHDNSRIYIVKNKQDNQTYFIPGNVKIEYTNNHPRYVQYSYRYSNAFIHYAFWCFDYPEKVLEVPYETSIVSYCTR
jgi:hypothetical protein